MLLVQYDQVSTHDSRRVLEHPIGGDARAWAPGTAHDLHRSQWLEGLRSSWRPTTDSIVLSDHQVFY